MKTYLKIIFSILLFSLLIPLSAKAITFENPFKTKSFEELIDAIIDFIFLVAIAIVPIMIIVAAFYFLTSGGNSEKVNTAKKIILYTFIGLFIVLLGKGIVAIIKQVLGGGS
jgi:L-cystine uptake protein TcyP (sodium:dicarboxylate symporter family)